MRLLICAGGTGGGVSPAIAVLDALRSENPDNLEILWVGGEDGMEAELVQRQKIPYAEIPAAGVHGVGLRTLPKNILKLLRGVLKSRKILREFKPDMLFFTGGYMAVPMAVAGWHIPSLLYVPDIEPGLALKALAWFAEKITVSAPPSAAYFSRKSSVIETGYPVRAELKQWEKEKARETLGFDAEKPLIMIVGGSKGARSINKAILANLPALLERAQIIHVSGKLDFEMVQDAQKRLNGTQAQNYRVYDYLHEEMGAALAAADLVISRAGASSLGEFPLFGLPALLVPYPYAWRYQKVNAEYLQEKGAAIMVRDETLADRLIPVVDELLSDREKLDAMRIAMKELAHPAAAKKIAAVLASLSE